MRVLVCGGRDFGRVPQREAGDIGERVTRAARERTLLNETLTKIDAERPISVILHGAAQGADSLAKEWALWKGLIVVSYPAQWRLYGNAAGPRRNAQMIQEGRPDLVVAFPGGFGTADCVRQARAAGVEVMEVTG